MFLKKSDIMEDVSVLTTIPKSNLDKLCKNISYCIAHCVHENDIDTEIGSDNITVADIGIGILYIFHNGKEVRYRFEPSGYLEEEILETISSKKSPVIEKLEEAFVNKITNAYKDIFK